MFSPDGRWWWDGVRWLPVRASRAGRPGPARRLLGQLPGFASGRVLPAVAAAVLLGACVLGVIAGLLAGRPALAGLCASAAATAVVVAHVWRQRARPGRLVLLLAALMVSVDACAASVVSLPVGAAKPQVTVQQPAPGQQPAPPAR